MGTLRILITGDRHWRCTDLADQIVARLMRRYGPNVVIVHGDPTGVVESFELVRKELVSHDALSGVIASLLPIGRIVAGSTSISVPDAKSENGRPRVPRTWFACSLQSLRSWNRATRR
jgi:hypothetical protein